MIVIVIFAVVFLFSLSLNAYDKIASYGREEKTVWEDGDSVYVQKNDNQRSKDGFMKRIA